MVLSMSTKHLIPDDIQALYEVHEWRNAAGVLATAQPSEWTDIQFALREFRLMRSEVNRKGGRKSLVASRFDSLLTQRGWVEKQFKTAIRIDDRELQTPTHKVDCYKNSVALEVEWNNKTEFYDRDLNNFRLLFDLRAISVGIIVGRASHLQAIFDSMGRGKSYGPSTTHLDKLVPRIEGGGGGGCPILIFGITRALYVEDPIPDEAPVDVDVEEDGDESN
jgi:hypothetical protein